MRNTPNKGLKGINLGGEAGQFKRGNRSGLALSSYKPIGFELLLAKQEEARAEADLALVGRRNLPAIADRWRLLEAGALALDYEARMQVRQLVADTFERIVLYHRGTMPDSDAPAHIDLVLIAKGGATRLLRIDRKSGEWVAQEDE